MASRRLVPALAICMHGVTHCLAVTEAVYLLVLKINRLGIEYLHSISRGTIYKSLKGRL